MPKKTKAIIPVESIVKKIIVLRGEKVLLDRDLAELYEVPTKVLNQAVKRNERRFPSDFMFRLTKQEKKELVTNCDRFRTLKHSSVLPRAFTEQGVAMLSSVLNSDRAIGVNIAIMRAFVKLRVMLASHKDLTRKIAELEKKYDEQFAIVFEAIQHILEEDEKPKKKIGYLKESQAKYGKGRRKS
ncbi:MAG: ORF6N domain-containing protein [Deltaproteobacteria bacterium]|nr:ORF6N domain-containing protein [Deltaproteobacteria bacterium]